MLKIVDKIVADVQVVTFGGCSCIFSSLIILANRGHLIMCVLEPTASCQEKFGFLNFNFDFTSSTFCTIGRRKSVFSISYYSNAFKGAKT
jgi:hypothetical protein